MIVVGGGNSAIEAALLLMPHNRVTLSYRGDDLFRAKEENRLSIEQAEHDGRLNILYKSNLKAVRDDEVEIATFQVGTFLPIAWLSLLALKLINGNMQALGLTLSQVLPGCIE